MDQKTIEELKGLWEPQALAPRNIPGCGWAQCYEGGPDLETLSSIARGQDKEMGQDGRAKVLRPLFQGVPGMGAITGIPRVLSLLVPLPAGWVGCTSFREGIRAMTSSQGFGTQSVAHGYNQFLSSGVGAMTLVPPETWPGLCLYPQAPSD